MKETIIIILLSAILMMLFSDRFIKCRRTKEADDLMNDLLDEIVFMNDTTENLN